MEPAGRGAVAEGRDGRALLRVVEEGVQLDRRAAPEQVDLKALIVDECPVSDCEKDDGEKKSLSLSTCVLWLLPVESMTRLGVARTTWDAGEGAAGGERRARRPWMTRLLIRPPNTHERSAGAAHASPPPESTAYRGGVGDLVLGAGAAGDRVVVHIVGEVQVPHAKRLGEFAVRRDVRKGHCHKGQSNESFDHDRQRN